MHHVPIASPSGIILPIYPETRNSSHTDIHLLHIRGPLQYPARIQSMPTMPATWIFTSQIVLTGTRVTAPADIVNCEVNDCAFDAVRAWIEGKFCMISSAPSEVDSVWLERDITVCAVVQFQINGWLVLYAWSTVEALGRGDNCNLRVAAKSAGNVIDVMCRDERITCYGT